MPDYVPANGPPLELPSHESGEAVSGGGGGPAASSNGQLAAPLALSSSAPPSFATSSPAAPSNAVQPHAVGPISMTATAPPAPLPIPGAPALVQFPPPPHTPPPLPPPPPPPPPLPAGLTRASVGAAANHGGDVRSELMEALKGNARASLRRTTTSVAAEINSAIATDV